MQGEPRATPAMAVKVRRRVHGGRWARGGTGEGSGDGVGVGGEEEELVNIGAGGANGHAGHGGERQRWWPWGMR